MKNAIVTLDFINEIVHRQGKLSGKGYAAFAEQHHVIENAHRALASARALGYVVIHVKIGFSSGYFEQPKGSKLFGKADQFGALQLQTWATELHDGIGALPEDYVIVKHRVSPFFGTPLESLLRARHIDQVLWCGCATDLAVSAAARDAHDRDFSTVVLSDCCAAASAEDHQHALASIDKFASVAESSAYMSSICGGAIE